VQLDDGETVRWLNQAIVSIWPVCLESFASQQFLMPLVPWFLAKYKPRFVVKPTFLNLESQLKNFAHKSLYMLLLLLAVQLICFQVLRSKNFSCVYHDF
jgi:hypothetical protein